MKYAGFVQGKDIFSLSGDVGCNDIYSDRDFATDSQESRNGNHVSLPQWKHMQFTN